MKLGPSNDNDPNVQLEIRAARTADSDEAWECFEWFEQCSAGWPWDITKPIAHQWPWGRDPVHDVVPVLTDEACCVYGDWCGRHGRKLIDSNHCPDSPSLKRATEWEVDGPVRDTSDVKDKAKQ